MAKSPLLVLLVLLSACSGSQMQRSEPELVSGPVVEEVVQPTEEEARAYFDVLRVSLQEGALTTDVELDAWWRLTGEQWALVYSFDARQQALLDLEASGELAAARKDYWEHTKACSAQHDGIGAADSGALEECLAAHPFSPLDALEGDGGKEPCNSLYLLLVDGMTITLERRLATFCEVWSADLSSGDVDADSRQEIVVRYGGQLPWIVGATNSSSSYSLAVVDSQTRTLQFDVEYVNARSDFGTKGTARFVDGPAVQVVTVEFDGEGCTTGEDGLPTPAEGEECVVEVPKSVLCSYEATRDLFVCP